MRKPWTAHLSSVKRVISKVYNGKRATLRIPRPTRREMDIISLMAAGNSSREIAEKLCISFDTVQTHRKNIYHKYQVGSSGELIALAHRNNWL